MGVDVVSYIRAGDSKMSSAMCVPGSVAVVDRVSLVSFRVVHFVHPRDHQACSSPAGTLATIPTQGINNPPTILRPAQPSHRLHTTVQQHLIHLPDLVLEDLDLAARPSERKTFMPAEIPVQLHHVIPPGADVRVGSEELPIEPSLRLEIKDELAGAHMLGDMVGLRVLHAPENVVQSGFSLLELSVQVRVREEGGENGVGGDE